jgi:hypothetical protein
MLLYLIAKAGDRMAIETVNATVDSTLCDSEAYYSLSEHDDYFTRDNLYEGMTGEQVTVSATKTKYNAKEGYRVVHNPFGSQYEYACGSGVDIRIFQAQKELAQIEVKNLTQQQKPYGTDFVRKKVLPRFSHSGGGLKLFVITFLSLLTKLAVQLLEQEGVTIIEVGERLTSEFYQNLKKLYVLGNSIHRAITNFWHRKAQPKKSPFFTNQLPLINVNTPIPITVKNVSNITRTHDTVSYNYNQITEFMREYSRILKVEETERLRKLHGG